MINIAKDILSLTDFKRRSSELLKQMNETHRPMVLTINGKAELIVQTAEDYQRLIDALEKVGAIEGIRRGLDSMKGGRGRPAGDVFDELESKHSFLHES